MAEIPAKLLIMSEIVRTIVSRLVLLVMLANFLGMSASAYSDLAGICIDDVQTVSVLGADTGSGKTAECLGCAHCCHLSHHFTGQLGVALTFATPVSGTCPSAVHCLGAGSPNESLFRPPRALA